MLFSVLIPVYNTSKYLDECINSVLSQTEKNFEIVLLNDGSTDNSGDICDSYAEKYPDFIRVIHKENEGLMMTRRRGFKEAKGDYFICLDSDDYLGRFICVGVFAMLSVQTIINIGMVITVLPVIGITLPLFSAGGTSVVVTYCAIGLVMSVAYNNRHRNRRR